MSASHLHLMLNHLPILGTLFGAAVLAWGLLRGSEEVSRVGLGFFAFAALAAGATYLTGEPAEEAIEGRPAFSEAVVEAHEEFALYALVGAVVLGVLALALLAFYRQSPLSPGAGGTALAAALVVGGLMAYTANLGGKISHPELRGSTAQVHSDAPPAAGNDAGADEGNEENEGRGEDEP
jgi:uncharacterized membrane protein